MKLPRFVYHHLAVLVLTIPEASLIWRQVHSFKEVPGEIWVALGFLVFGQAAILVVAVASFLRRWLRIKRLRPVEYRDQIPA